MKRLICITALACVLSFAFTTLSFAKVEPNKFEASVYGGYLLGDDVGSTTSGNVTFNFDEMDDAFGFGGALAYNFTKNWALEGSIGYWPGSNFSGTATDGSSTVDLSSGTDQLHLFLNGIYHILPEKDIVPYLAAGIGMVRFSGDASALGQTVDYGENDLAFNVGGGIKWFFTDSFNLRFEAKDVITSMEDLDTMHMPQFTVGLGFTF